MPILAGRLSAEAMSVEFIGDSIWVVLAEGREISAPSGSLGCATPPRRNAATGV
jgi:hypothetical protein